MAQEARNDEMHIHAMHTHHKQERGKVKAHETQKRISAPRTKARSISRMFALVERDLFCSAFFIALIGDMLTLLEMKFGLDFEVFDVDVDGDVLIDSSELMAVVAAMELHTGQALRDCVEHITHRKMKCVLMLMAQRYSFVVSDGQLSEGCAHC